MTPPDDDEPDSDPSERPPPKWNSEGFFPATDYDLPKQVRIHHEVIRKHATQFANVFTWQHDLHRRIRKIEKRDPSKAIFAMRAELRGAKKVVVILWTVALALAGITIAVLR